ncbi:MAG: Rv3235 family protein [Actinomycetia bacterium]|nr:Rv3235 family protein [Actinomycetes bacterium]
MTALPAPSLPRLRIVPIARPRLTPAPLPGMPFPDHGDVEHTFEQETLTFDEAPPPPPPPALPPSDLPDPVPLARPLAQALIEVIAGRRPVIQLLRWSSPTVYAALTAQAAVAHRRRLGQSRMPMRLTVRRVIVSQPQPDVTELAIVVIDGARVRAIALSLRGHDERWIIEALQVG